MADETFEHLVASRCSDESRLLAALQSSSPGVISVVTARSVLLDESETDEGFAYSRPIRLEVVRRLPRDGDVEVLQLIVDHLSQVPFVGADDDQVDRYLAEFNDALRPIVRTYAYLAPDELVMVVAERALGRSVELDESIGRQEADRISLLCDIVMGGGYFPSFDHATTLRHVICRLEAGI